METTTTDRRRQGKDAGATRCRRVAEEDRPDYVPEPGDGVRVVSGATLGGVPIGSARPQSDRGRAAYLLELRDDYRRRLLGQAARAVLALGQRTYDKRSEYPAAAIRECEQLAAMMYAIAEIGPTARDIARGSASRPPRTDSDGTPELLARLKNLPVYRYPLYTGAPEPETET